MILTFKQNRGRKHIKIVASENESLIKKTRAFAQAEELEDAYDLDDLFVNAEPENVVDSAILAVTKDWYKIAQAHDELNKYSSLKDAYDDLSDQSNVNDSAVKQYYEFNEYFFNEHFSSHAEAAKAVYFGKVRSWSDKYAYFDGYGNVCTIDELPEIDLNNRETIFAIVESWIEEYC